ncbi:MAG TPA: hypothetical protein VMJ32_18635 [Pirellulales bacterium]|nr:hypothetical protein [Pirellulales bacterium]
MSGTPITIDSPTGMLPSPRTASANWVLYVVSAVAIATILIDEVIALQCLSCWAYDDHGGHLVLVQLLNSNRQPNVDFGYSYGPLTVLICQAWAVIFGNHWSSFLYLCLLFRVISTMLIVSVAAQFRLSKLVQAVFALGLFRWLPYNCTIARPGELIGLLLAIRCLMSSRLDLALLGCTLATLFRPSIGFLIGFALICIVLWRAFLQLNTSWTSRIAQLLRFVAPSAVLESVVGLIYIGLHGATSYVLTIFPIAGSHLYANRQASFLKLGWDRFFPADQNWKGYLTNPSHLDLIVLLTLAAGLLVSVVQLIRADPQEDKLGSPSHLHLVLFFIATVVFFTLTISYSALACYLPFFWLGFIAAWKVFGSGLGRVGIVIMALIGINLVLHAVFVMESVERKLTSIADDFHLTNPQLVVDRTEQAELTEIKKYVDGQTIAFPCMMGDVTLLKQFGISVWPNHYWCLSPGIASSQEIDDARAQVRNVEYVLLKKPHIAFSEDLLALSEMHTEVLYDGKNFDLLHVIKAPQSTEATR